MKKPIAIAALTLLTAAAHAAPAYCPNASEQLADLLDGSMRRVGSEGDIQAAFEVDARGRVQPTLVEGKRSYHAPVRLALESMDCEAGTPQRYVVSIHFTQPGRRSVESTQPVTIAIAASAPR